MRELSTLELAAVSGGEVTPLITDPQSEIGKMLNDMHEAYINYLNMYVFPYIYYCF